MAIIQLVDIKKNYTLGKTTIHALRGLSFNIEKGDFLSIVGPSGCGKTTLLNIIGCIDKPDSGSIFLEGKKLDLLNDNQEADIRLSRLGFIFQTFNLIPVLNIFENIEFPLIIHRIPKSVRKKRVNELIETVGLKDFVKHKPDELSGGQRQRVAIARALVNSPQIVIADEPTANLDSETGTGIIREMMRLNSEQKVTFIFSTHNPEIVQYARKIIRLKDGMVSEITIQGADR